MLGSVRFVGWGTGKVGEVGGMDTDADADIETGLDG